MAAKLKVTQVKSTISHIARNRATVRALGLHGIGSTSIVTDNPATRGMVRAVRFLVTVEEIEDGANPDTRRRKQRHETPRPPAGPRLAQATHPRRPWHRGRQGQDRRPRHQGPEGTRRWRHPRPGSRVARRRSTCASRSCSGFKNRFKIEYEVVNIGAIGALADRGAFEFEDTQEVDQGRPDHGQPGHPARRRAGPDPQQAAQDPRCRGADGPALRRRRRVHRVRPREDRGRRWQRQCPRGPDLAARGAGRDPGDRGRQAGRAPECQGRGRRRRGRDRGVRRRCRDRRRRDAGRRQARQGPAPRRRRPPADEGVDRQARREVRQERQGLRRNRRGGRRRSGPAADEPAPADEPAG